MPIKTRSKLRAAAAGAAVAGLFIAVGSSAIAGGDNRGEPYPSVVVNYGDLDLTTEAGVRTLSRRIGAAATKVCGGAADLRDALAVVESRVCRDHAIARAVQAVGNPRLAALFGIRSHHG